jgi:hypothetical protein
LSRTWTTVAPPATARSAAAMVSTMAWSLIGR